MKRDQYDFIIVGGRLGGQRPGQPLSADRSNQVLVLEAGRLDYKWDVFVHMPAALTIPIGNRFYDWKYESEAPSPTWAGEGIYHARGKLLGGSSSINGMIFQRGNPMDYERWAGDPGMSTWGLRALPAVLQADGELPGRGRRVSRHTGPWCSNADRRRAHSFGPSSARWRRAATSSPVTSTATARRASRPSTDDPPWTATERRARLPAPGDESREPRGPCRVFVNRILFEDNRAVGVEVRERGQVSRVFAKEVILCGGAFNSPQLLQLSEWANAGRASRARGAGRGRPARSRREPPGPPRGLHPVLMHPAGLGRRRRSSGATAR